MPTIRKLPSGKWNVQVRNKGRIHKSKTFVHRRSAERWGQKIELELGRTHPFFVDAGHAYCMEMLDRKPSQLLAANRVDRIARYYPLQKAMDQITLQDITSFKKARLEEVSRTTCRDELLMIKRVFRWYIRECYAETGRLLVNPCDLLTVPPANKPRDRVITRAELGELLGHMSPSMAVVVELAYETAMRRSEILKLTPRDLHLEQRFLCVVDGKEGSRDVPLSSRAIELLKAASERCHGAGDRIFPMAAYSVSQALRRARLKLGMDAGVRFHQLRHSRITEVARMGFNQAQIMAVSGHRDIRSVQRYTHLNVRDVLRLIE